MLEWLTVLASLTGVWLNIRKHVACFWIWGVTNAVWACIDFSHGITAQAVLQAVYCALAVYGIAQWTAQKKPSVES